MLYTVSVTAMNGVSSFIDIENSTSVAPPLQVRTTAAADQTPVIVGAAIAAIVLVIIVAITIVLAFIL